MSEKMRVPTTEEIEAIKEWLKGQPHLPNVISDNLARQFIHVCNYDLQKTMKLIDLFYTLRNNAPEIFANRDPMNLEIKNVFENSDMCPLPQHTAENYKVFFYRLRNTNPDLFDMNQSTKAFLMLADARLSSDEKLSSGEVPIFDMKGLSLRFLTKLVYSTLKKYMQYVQVAHPVMLKQSHVINVLPFVNMLFSIMKPLINSELAKTIHFHVPESETLYKFVPKEILPEEYGGNGGKIDDIKNYWINEINKLRDFYLDESLWKVDESKRPSGDLLSSTENRMNDTTLSID